MKNYKITVNGKTYEVTVEDAGASSIQYKAAPSVGEASKPAPKVAPAPAQAAPAPAAPNPAPKAAPAGGDGSVVAPLPGTVLSIEVKEGDEVKVGQVVLILEAMKMENEIVAPEDGTVASINVSTGDSVEPGATLATLN